MFVYELWLNAICDKSFPHFIVSNIPHEVKTVQPIHLLIILIRAIEKCKEISVDKCRFFF